MKFWFDTEFIEDGKTIDLLSIGIVSEDGRELYLQSLEANLYAAREWVRENVFPHLNHVAFWFTDAKFMVSQHKTYIKHDWCIREVLRAKILEFIGKDVPEFWGYYADYDWVVLCQLFGTMMDLPKGWPMYCRDIKQWCDQLGNPHLPEQGKGEHNALADARWNKTAWEFLDDLQRRT